MKIGIIGAGPAGVSCGVQLKRFGFDPLIFEKNKIGGLVHQAYKIYNLLGFPEGIGGKRYVKKIESSVKKYKLKIIFEEIKEVNFIDNKFELKSKNRYKFDILVIASGTKPKEFEGFEDFNQIEDIKNKRNKKIGIIGGSDVAFDWALSLKNCGKIFIFHRSKKPGAIKHLKELIFKNKKIKYLENSKINKIERIDNLFKLKIKRNKKEKIFILDYLLNATGRVPEKSFLNKELIKSEKKLTKKGILYFIGDVAHQRYRQISIALGDGLLTAQKIYEKINSYGNNK